MQTWRETARRSGPMILQSAANITVTKKLLDGADVAAVLEQVRREGVTERVAARAPGDPGGLDGPGKRVRQPRPSRTPLEIGEAPSPYPAIFGPIQLGKMDKRRLSIEDHKGRWVRKQVLPMSPD